MAEEFDIAISFAGEDRASAESLASALKSRGLRVFYDRDQQANLWGKDLYQHLADIYANKARFCVVLVSRHYVEKDWTRHELASAQGRAFKQRAEYILPVRIDDTALPGLPPTAGYLDLRRMSIDNVADHALAKVRAEKPVPPVGAVTTQPAPLSSGRTMTLNRSPTPASDLERKRFLQDAFGLIRSDFQDALRAAKESDPAMEFEFEMPNQREFECALYVAGKRRAGARIWHGEPMMQNSILYSAATRGVPGGFNEMLTIVDGSAGLCLRPTMAGLDVPTPSEVLTPREAAEYLWAKMTRPLRS